MKEIYLDNAASWPVWLKVYREVEKAGFGNPSSLHSLGEKSLEKINEVRGKIAQEIGAKTQGIMFTSGGSESCNWALWGLDLGKKKKILISGIEHPCVSECADFLGKSGKEIVKIPFNKEGRIDLEFLEKELTRGKVGLVSVMHVNNETGIVNNLEAIGKLCKKYGAVFHTDSVQSFGKLGVDVRKMNIGLLSGSGHKIGGFKGCGFLYVKDGVKMKPWIYGGGQERGLRSGTENVQGIVSMGVALDEVKRVNWNKVSKIRERLAEGLVELGGKVNPGEFPGILSVSFPGVSGEDLVVFLSEKGIFCSTGSACASRKQKESKALKELGLNKKERDGNLRFSFGDKITEKDVDKVVSEVERALKILR